MRLPIRYKFFLTASLITVIVVGLLYTLGAGYLRRDKEAYAFETAADAAASRARKAAEYFDFRARTLHAVGEIAASATLAGDQKRDLIRAFFGRADDVHEVVVLNEAGEEVLKLSLGGAGSPFHGACARLADAPGPGARALARDLQSGALLIAIGGRGVSCMAVDPAVTIGGGGLFEATIFGDGGRVLFADRPGVDAAPLWALVAKRPAAAGSGTFSFDNAAGERHLAAFAAPPGSGVVAVVVIHEAKVMGAVRALERNLLVVAGIAILIAAVLSTVLAARMTRSIAVLEGASTAIARGEFDQEIVLSSRDELEDLAAALTRMSRELHARDLEIKDGHVRLIQAEKLAAFGQLGAGIAHEIKNPLTGMLGYVQLSQRAAGKEGKIGEYLKTVESEILRCKGIIDDLLKFSRQDRGAKGPVTLPEVIGNAVKLVRHQMMLMGVDLREEYDPATPQAWGNANQIQQVGINLVLNAGQACAGLKGDPKTAGRKFVVTVSCRPGDGGAIVEVADNGGGIPPEVAGRIFEPFFTTKPEGQGTGLGLSVSYGIIREHQGEITFDSRPGDGTTFRIKLPAVEPASSGATA